MNSSPKKSGLRQFAGLPAPPPPPAPPAAAPKLVATPQIMNFTAGLYSIEIAPQPVVVGPEGLAAPCIRLDRLRPSPAHAAAFISTLAETDLLAPNGPPAFVRITGEGTVPVLLTVYSLENMPNPELRIRLLTQDAAPQLPPTAEPALPPPGPAAAKSVLLVHVERQGDTSVPAGAWGGTPGSGHAIEGFAVRPPDSLPPDSVEYQGALGLEWDTPWFRPDEFCGSRGMMLPLIGLRIRVTGEPAAHTIRRYWASFVGHGERGPFAQGALCACDGAPLEALRIEFTPPDAAPTPQPKRRGLLAPRT